MQFHSYQYGKVTNSILKKWTIWQRCQKPLWLFTRVNKGKTMKIIYFVLPLLRFGMYTHWAIVSILEDIQSIYLSLAICTQRQYFAQHSPFVLNCRLVLKIRNNEEVYPIQNKYRTKEEQLGDPERCHNQFNCIRFGNITIYYQLILYCIEWLHISVSVLPA